MPPEIRSSVSSQVKKLWKKYREPGESLKACMRRLQHVLLVRVGVQTRTAYTEWFGNKARLVQIRKESKRSHKMWLAAGMSRVEKSTKPAKKSREEKGETKFTAKQ